MRRWVGRGWYIMHVKRDFPKKNDSGLPFHSQQLASPYLGLKPRVPQETSLLIYKLQRSFRIAMIFQALTQSLRR